MTDDLNLYNPYSKVACLMLYIYSMELGSPPLYSAVNKACREMDESVLSNLGPFIRALHLVCEYAESNKKQTEKITEGKTLNARVKFNLGGAFLLWRGAVMGEDQLQPFVANQGTWIHLKGHTSCSRSPKIALDFAISAR